MCLILCVYIYMYIYIFAFQPHFFKIISGYQLVYKIDNCLYCPLSLVSHINYFMLYEYYLNWLRSLKVCHILTYIITIIILNLLSTINF
jgi:hypothetical protein